MAETFARAGNVAWMNEPFDAELFEELALVEPTNFWFIARNRLILWALNTWFPQLESFLEVGCGTGFVLTAVARAFPDAEIAANDIYPEALEFARDRVPRAHVFQADARELALDRPVDVVGVFDVLEHISDDRAALAAITKCIRPAGGVVLTVPQHPVLWSAFDDASHHVRRYRRGELEAKVEDAGLTVVRSTSFVSLLLPVLAAARLTGRRRDALSVAGALRQTDAGATVWSAAMRAELALLRLGVSFPLGGSRLVVARSQPPFRTMTS